MGIVAGRVNTPNQSAAEIVAEMMAEAIEVLRGASKFVGPAPGPAAKL